MSIILFIAVLFVLILVHEWGHYITAKLTGMKVDEFGIGFPPKVWSWKKGETEYSLNALPIGGFVRILGENGLSEEDGGVPEADKSRSFNARPKWAQAVVLLAGVTMNMLLAWLLIMSTYLVGVQSPVAEEEAGPSAQLIIGEIIPGGPAADALMPGAVITNIFAGDQTIENLTPTGLTDFVTAVAPEEITIEYTVGGDTGSAVIAPIPGLIEEDPERYLIGVRPLMVEKREFTIVEAVTQGTQETWLRTKVVATGLFGLISQSISGTADYSQVAGPVGIAVMTGDVAQLGVIAVMYFMAMLSISLAVINLLPFPALDGGRLVFVAIEAVTGKEIPPQWAGRVNLIGFALLMLLMVAVTYNDIVRLIS